MKIDTRAVEILVEQIKPVLAGQHPVIQGGVLADLVSLWLAGHAPAARETLLELHVEAVRNLTPLNEGELFGKAGHPAS